MVVVKVYLRNAAYMWRRTYLFIVFWQKMKSEKNIFLSLFGHYSHLCMLRHTTDFGPWRHICCWSSVKTKTSIIKSSSEQAINRNGQWQDPLGMPDPTKISVLI